MVTIVPGQCGNFNHCVSLKVIGVEIRELRDVSGCELWLSSFEDVEKSSREYQDFGIGREL